MITDTPRTDSVAFKDGPSGLELVHADTSRTLERDLSSVTEERDSLKRALEEAVDLIHSWHNMGIKDGSPCDVWPIYRDNAPEMKRLFAALSASAAKEGGKI